MTSGIFNSLALTTDIAEKSFAGAITRLMPNGQAILFGLTSMLQTETAVQTEHGFFTKTMLFPQVTFTAAGQLSTDTTFTVVSTSNILPGMILRVDNSAAYENVIVNTVISATQFTVTRAVGTVVATAVPANAVAYQIGNAYEEASLRPQSLIINPVRVTNLTQIFRNTWAISGTIAQTKMIAGDTNVAESRTDCSAFHAVDIEKAFFFGQKSTGTRNGQPFRTMDGLINIVGTAANYPSYYGGTTNVFTAGGTTTYPQLEGFLDPVFNQTTDPKIGNERLMFVGGTAKKVITGITRLATGSFYEIVDHQTNWGLKYNTITTSRGTFTMIEHPLLNTNSSYSKMAVVVDLSTFRAAYLGDRRTQSQEFNQGGVAVDNGIDAVGGTLTTEVTCEVKNPPANAVIYNLTAAAAG